MCDLLSCGYLICLCHYTDREAVQELDARLKETRKSAGEKVRYHHCNLKIETNKKTKQKMLTLS